MLEAKAYAIVGIAFIIMTALIVAPYLDRKEQGKQRKSDEY